IARLQANGLTAESGILEAQTLMLDDPALLDGASEFIAQGRPADDAVAAALAPFAEMLRASPDPVFQARAVDVEDVVEQLRVALHRARGTSPPRRQPGLTVRWCSDLPPSREVPPPTRPSWLVLWACPRWSASPASSTPSKMASRCCSTATRAPS